MRARSLASGARDAAIEALVEAFDRDPFARWLYPDGSVRREAHQDLFASAIASPDTVTEVTDDLDGAAIWYPPGRYPRHSEDAKYADPTSSFSLFESIEMARPPGDFWFLAFLGARTTGRGAGSTLVRHRPALAEGSSALWTANEANLTFYERFGYRTRSRHEVPGARAFWLTRE